VASLEVEEGGREGGLLVEDSTIDQLFPRGSRRRRLSSCTRQLKRILATRGFRRLLVGVTLLVLVAIIFKVVMPTTTETASYKVQWPQGAEKLGAGLLVTLQAGDKASVLLLYRNSRHNDKTWGLPGGNVDAEDESLTAAALREAREELGHLPQGTEFLGEVLTRRGKHESKFYTVIIARAPADQKEAYSPELNLEEHSDWRWFDMEEVRNNAELSLHPVVEMLFKTHGYSTQMDALLAGEPLPATHDRVQQGPSGAVGQVGCIKTAPGVPVSPDIPSSAEKIGAGIFIMTHLDNSLHALLLKRNSKHNDNTWGIPGGNADAGEIMLDTASREAVEEMGGCPGMTILDYVLTRRGKQLQKYFTVFLAYSPPEEAAAFVPELDSEENDQWRWVALDEMLSMELPLHPVVEIVVHDDANLRKVKQVAGSVTG